MPSSSSPSLAPTTLELAHTTVHQHTTFLRSSTLSFIPFRPSYPSLLPSSSMSFYTYTTATTFLEHASSSSDPITLTLETDSPAVPELDSSSTLAQAEHALSSSTFFPADRASAGFVLCRIIEDGYVLELRWVAFSQAAPGATHRFAELDQQSTLPPVRFVFPARLVPTPAFSFADDTGTLKVLALTEAGYLYVLAFSGPSLFYSAAQGAEYQRYELAVAGLATRFPVLMHGVDERTVVIGCAEGYVLSVDIDEDSAGECDRGLCVNRPNITDQS